MVHHLWHPLLQCQWNQGDGGRTLQTLVGLAFVLQALSGDAKDREPDEIVDEMRDRKGLSNMGGGELVHLDIKNGT